MTDVGVLDSKKYNPKFLFAFSEGLLFTNQLINNPFRDPGIKMTTDAKIDLLQDLKVSYIGFERFMITSVPRIGVDERDV